MHRGLAMCGGRDFFKGLIHMVSAGGFAMRSAAVAVVAVAVAVAVVVVVVVVVVAFMPP
jgi:hypothetical protein